MSAQAAKKTTSKRKNSQLAKPTSKSNDFELNDFEQFLEISQNLWMIISDDGAITKHNKALEALTGLKTKDIQSKHFIDLFSEQDREELLRAMQSFHVSSPNASENIFEYEARILTKDGETRWLKCKQQLCGDTMYCVGQDIQNEKEREKTMLRHQSQLSEAESIGRMGHWSWVLGKDDIKWSDAIYNIFGTGSSNAR